MWITLGPDGNLWFTEPGADELAPEDFGQVDAVARITPSGIITEFPVTRGSRPTDATAGAHGNIWFTEIAASQIGRIPPAGVLIGEYPTPTPNSGPLGITDGPTGGCGSPRRMSAR
jgi:virginiamycin B lyase